MDSAFFGRMWEFLRVHKLGDDPLLIACGVRSIRLKRPWERKEVDIVRQMPINHTRFESAGTALFSS